MSDLARAVREGATQMRSELGSFKLPLKPYKFAAIVGTIAVCLLIIGFCCLIIRVPTKIPTGQICKNVTIYDYHKMNDLEYSDCMPSVRGKTCHESTKSCICTIDMELSEPVDKDVVIAYYLDTFNNTVDSKFYQSRDNSQLSGNLSSKVSDLCHPYDYNNNIPIAPCGALANAMFTDKITLHYIASDSNLLTVVPQMKYGLLREEEKKEFHNPGNENITVAFQNFTKPKDWKINVWELDPNIPENNGFQNEAFIVWMRPDLKIKPLWRLNRTGIFENGLPKENYTFIIHYNYPYSLYSGPRHLILYQEVQNVIPQCHTTTADSDEALSLGWGITCTLIAVIALSALIIIIWRKGKVDKPVDEGTANNSPPTHKPHPPSQASPADGKATHKVNKEGDSESQLLEKTASTHQDKPEHKPLATLVEDD